MHIVPPVPAFVSALCLLLVPGLVLLALLPRRDREALRLDEALYLAFALSVAASAWLALVLAEAGVFSLVTAGVLLGAASLSAALVGWRRLGWPLPRPTSWRALAPTALLLALALFLQARPTEYIVGGRDPGAYIAAMGVIARTGGLVYEDPAVLSIPEEDLWLFYRHPENPPFSWSRFMGFRLESPESGRVYPQFFHLFPAFGAYLFQSMGLKGALATPPIFGVLGLFGVYFTARRLFGEPVAVLAALLLNLNVLQVWFGRYPVSEGMSQYLMFLGLLAFSHWEERRSRAFGVIAGVAFGLSLLVRIDSVLIVVPLGLFLVTRRARGQLAWKDAAALLVPFLLLALHAAFHGFVWAQHYVLDIVSRPYWRQPPTVWAIVAGLGILALIGAHRVEPLLVRWCTRRTSLLRTTVMAGFVLLALYAYFVRPALSAWAGGDGNPETAALADPGWLHALGFQRLAAHDAQAFLRLGWVLSPLALALGLLGLLLVIREWRPRFLFPVLTAATLSAFYFYKIRVFNDYPFAFRRFVPLIAPLLLVLACFFLVRLAARGGLRRAVAALLVAGLVGIYVRDTRVIFNHVDWRGAVGFVKDVARRFGPSDIVIFEQPRSIHLLSLPLWAAHGVNILELARFNPDPDRLHHLIESWRPHVRNIYFVHTYRTELCSVFLQRVGFFSFGTSEWYAYNKRPGAPEFRSLHFEVSRVIPPEELQVPALPEVDIGGFDDFQVSGFFDKEGGPDRTYRWTGACASVYVPSVRAGQTLTITAAVEHRPDSPPVTASLAGVPLGGFVVGSQWEQHVLSLPDPLPPGPPVLRLDMPAWRPINVVPESEDTRDLGIMVDRISFGAGDREGAAPITSSEPPAGER